MDSQTIELVGRHRLTSELLQAGLEVAFPARDRGVDLIAYLDVEAELGRFIARPIQLKVATRRSFGIWKKYERFQDLLFAFVWHLDGEGDPVTYALTCPEAIGVGDAMGWTKTASWTEQQRYENTSPGKDLCEKLERFRVTPERSWRSIIVGADRS